MSEARPGARYRLAIFDFDGTLADSFPFFASVFNDLAQRHGFRRVEPHEVGELRRRSPREIMAHVGMPAWKLPVVARSFIALMNGNAERVRLFEGVSELLRGLAAEGVELAIVTSNSRANVERVLGSGNRALIGRIECGVSIFGKRARIRRVLRRSGVAPDEAIYIGDQATDCEAARAERVAFGAVAWGYGHVDALNACAPDHLFAHAVEILQVVSPAAR